MKVIDANKLKTAQNEKFKYKIEDYLRNAFSIYSKHWLEFSLYSLIAFILLSLSIFTIIGPYLIYYPLLMGYCRVTEKIENDESFVFSDFFIGFNKWNRFLGLIALVMVISFGIISPYIFTILNLETDGLINTTVGLYSLAFIPFYCIFMIVFSVLIFLAPYILYFDDNISFSESLRLSYLIAKKNFWSILIFLILIGIIFQFGFYLFFIFAFVTIPIACIMSYLFVKDLLLVSDRELNIIVD